LPERTAGYFDLAEIQSEAYRCGNLVEFLTRQGCDERADPALRYGLQVLEIHRALSPHSICVCQ